MIMVVYTEFHEINPNFKTFSHRILKTSFNGFLVLQNIKKEGSYVPVEKLFVNLRHSKISFFQFRRVNLL